MDRIVIKGGHRLSGEVQVEGAKNAVLPVLQHHYWQQKVLAN